MAPPPVGLEPEPQLLGDVHTSFEVPSFIVEDGTTCRYLTVVRGVDAGAGEYRVYLRWSEMEGLVKELRATFPSMPDSLALPKYYFKTLDEAKLQTRREQLQDFWDALTDWVGQDRMHSLLDSRPMQWLLSHETARHDSGDSRQDGYHPRHDSADSGGFPSSDGSPGSRPPPPPSVSEGGGAAAAAAAAAAPPPPLSPATSEDESPYFGSGRRKVAAESFELLSTLGKGSFGKVLLVRKKDTGGIFAMKILQKRKVVARNQVEHTKAERSVLERMRHIPFIVHVHWAFQTPENLFLVLDYVPGGELFFHLKEHGRFAENAVMFYAAQMVLALEEIHRIGVVYRDLKPENLLMDQDGYMRLTDFGLSKEGGAELGAAEITDTAGADTFCGTAEYLAPELLIVPQSSAGEGASSMRRSRAHVPHGKAVDMWSLGILIYEMIHGLPPFYDTNTKRMYEKILTARLSFSRYFSANARDLITRLLDRDPTQRLAGVPLSPMHACMHAHPHTHAQNATAALRRHTTG